MLADRLVGRVVQDRGSGLRGACAFPALVVAICDNRRTGRGCGEDSRRRAVVGVDRDNRRAVRATHGGRDEASKQIVCRDGVRHDTAVVRLRDHVLDAAAVGGVVLEAPRLRKLVAAPLAAR